MQGGISFHFQFRDPTSRAPFVLAHWLDVSQDLNHWLQSSRTEVLPLCHHTSPFGLHHLTTGLTTVVRLKAGSVRGESRRKTGNRPSQGCLVEAKRARQMEAEATDLHLFLPERGVQTTRKQGASATMHE